MKIALVSPYDWATPGGVNQHITHLEAAFVRRGHSVRIIAPSSRPEVSAERPHLIVIGRPVPVPAGGSIARITLSLRLSGAVKRVLAEERFDVVHLHEPLLPALPITVLRYSQAVNVGTFHAFSGSSYSRNTLGYHYGRRILRRWFRRLDGKIAVSPAAREFVSQYFPGYYNIIPNGIDYWHFANPAVEPLERYQDGKRNLLFVGRMEKRKGVKYLLRAFVALKREWPNTRLIVVGPDSRLRRGYEQSLRKAGVSDVEFVGYASYADLARYYRTAEIFCSPATGNESFGIVLLEAMAAGTPLVASDIDGYNAVVRPGQEGLLVPPKDPAALAQAIGRLLADDALRARMGAQGRATASAYDWSHVAERILNYYQRLLRARAPSPAFTPGLLAPEGS